MDVYACFHGSVQAELIKYTETRSGHGQMNRSKMHRSSTGMYIP